MRIMRASHNLVFLITTNKFEGKPTQNYILDIVMVPV